jgi:hypothetical protein
MPVPVAVMKIVMSFRVHLSEGGIKGGPSGMVDAGRCRSIVTGQRRCGGDE